MKTYKGSTSDNHRPVTVDQRLLPFKMHPEQANPAHFFWGDLSPGSLNLAYSLLADAVDEDAAVLWSREFLESQVKNWRDDWTITDAEISQFCERIIKDQSSVHPDNWTEAGSHLVPEQPFAKGQTL